MYIGEDIPMNYPLGINGMGADELKPQSANQIGVLAGGLYGLATASKGDEVKRAATFALVGWVGGIAINALLVATGKAKLK